MEHKFCFGNNNKEPLINFMFALYLTVTSTHVVPRPPSQQDCQFWASWLLRYYGGRGGSCSHGVCGKGMCGMVVAVVAMAAAVAVVVCYRDYKDHTRS